MEKLVKDTVIGLHGQVIGKNKKFLVEFNAYEWM